MKELTVKELQTALDAYILVDKLFYRIELADHGYCVLSATHYEWSKGFSTVEELYDYLINQTKNIVNNTKKGEIKNE